MMQHCALCRELYPLRDLNQDDLCEVCAALDSLKDTMRKRGIIKPDLFENQINDGRSVLPPGDR